MKKPKESTIKSIHEIPWVAEVPIKVYRKESGYKALVNDKTKKTISIVSNAYQPIQHKDVWDEASKHKKYKIVKGQLYNRGRVFMIEIIDRKPAKVELVPGDYMESRVRIFNSYDGSKALTVQSYGIRLVCSNGMVAPVMLSQFRKAHVYQNIQVPEIGKAIELGMAVWQGNTDYLVYTQQQVNKVFKALENPVVVTA